MENGRDLRTFALVQRGKEVLEELDARKEGKKMLHRDGYVNMVTRYGTAKDSSEQFEFMAEGATLDSKLCAAYEGDGLFAKIIDVPAEEAVKHGFDIGVNDEDVTKYLQDKSDELDVEGNLATALKWSRLFGGSIIVMMVDDGKGLDEPLNWDDVRNIDELLVYERAVVQPDYNSLYNNNPGDRKSYRRGKTGQPEYFYVFSSYGSFTVHESRCLVFRNGRLPENCTSNVYRYWGAPEYTRIKRALQQTVTAHGDGVRMLERSVQAIYKMKGLSSKLSTTSGEDDVLKRIDAIDMARGILNSIIIDSDGEDYSFQTFQLSGVKDILDAQCNLLSSVSHIPQTLLFGSSPTGENATGKSDMENFYNYVEGDQKQNLKSNLRRLLDAILLSGVYQHKIKEMPDYQITFNPLWNMNDEQQANIDKMKADMKLVTAQTIQTYVDMQAIDPAEVRAGLQSSEALDPEDLLDKVGATGGSSDDFGLGEENAPTSGVTQKNITSPLNANTALTERPSRSQTQDDESDEQKPFAAAVILVMQHHILVGYRKNGGGWCSAGGHIEEGESPAQAAVRESAEEFGVTINKLEFLGPGYGLPGEDKPIYIYVSDDFYGLPHADDVEMSNAALYSLDEILRCEVPGGNVFQPFYDSLVRYKDVILPYLAPRNADAEGDVNG